MLEHAIKQFASQLLAGAVQSNLPDEMRQQLAAAFWEVTYMQRLGMLQVLPADFPPPTPPPPPPGFSPLGVSLPAFPLPPELMEADLLMDVINVCTEGNTQKADLQDILQNKARRLASVRNLAQRLDQVLRQLEQEIVQLEQE